MADTTKYAGEIEFQRSTKRYHVFEGQMVILYINRSVMSKAPKKIIVTVEGA